MSFFSNFLQSNTTNSKKTVKIIAPLSGKIINIEDVPDAVFADKIVGDGIAIVPTGNTIVSPVNGEIKKVFNTLHAISIKSNEGIELFIHFGIDTVKLKGKGFCNIIQEKKTVKKGDILISFDLEFLKKQAKSVITPIIISNIEQLKKLEKMSGVVIAGKTTIMVAHM
ncbi:PTS glucose transporter subunit IIA [Buchnera aphidicola (Thelaxes californica)]|uniref:PTS system glucose-specific EIIA component n=1 Tax=Buchnera aphidicola (Thelaxes californica) TaxID=1315998 RepID=A0A4D6YLR9_9GAMM|nr:PTS glucose transporter subunit IIA [Buchnera aphidicola]QCI26608.1 PTS glucose transporter subunit IIA [Buchnera aphidicola (Thelaxes californica)]